MRTALTDTSTPGIDLVCFWKMSLSSFWMSLDIFCWRVVSINSFLKSFSGCKVTKKTTGSRFFRKCVGRDGGRAECPRMPPPGFPLCPQSASSTPRRRPEGPLTERESAGTDRPPGGKTNNSQKKTARAPCKSYEITNFASSCHPAGRPDCLKNGNGPKCHHSDTNPERRDICLTNPIYNGAITPLPLHRSFYLFPLLCP